jgi:hypothetical protein
VNKWFSSNQSSTSGVGNSTRKRQSSSQFVAERGVADMFEGLSAHSSASFHRQNVELSKSSEPRNSASRFVEVYGIPSIQDALTGSLDSIAGDLNLWILI